MSYSKEQFIEDFKNAYNQSQQLHFIYRYVENGGKNISSIKFETVDREANIDITIVVTLSDGTTLRGNTIRVANSTLSGFVQTLEENVSTLTDTVDNLNNDVNDLKKYKGFNITFPISKMEGVKMQAVSNIDVANDTLPADFHRTITSQEKTDLYTLLLKAVKYGYIIDTQSNEYGTILTLLVCDIRDNYVYIVFGGKDCNDNLGMSYTIYYDVNDANKLNITYGEV